jgi:hypothetical protein
MPAAPADQEYLQQQASQSEDIEDPDERDVSAQLMSFIAKYDTLSPSQLVAQRQELGFKRSTDGRVFLLAKGGEQFAVKLDMQVPGLLLLQDQEGYCFYIPPDGEGEWAGGCCVGHAVGSSNCAAHCLQRASCIHGLLWLCAVRCVMHSAVVGPAGACCCPP